MTSKIDRSKRYEIRSWVHMQFMETWNSWVWWFACIKAKYEKWNEVWDHVHTREDEFFYVLSWQIEFRLWWKAYIKSAWEFISCPRNIVHWFSLLSDAAEFLIMYTPWDVWTFFEHIALSNIDIWVIPPDLWLYWISYVR